MESPSRLGRFVFENAARFCVNLSSSSVPSVPLRSRMGEHRLCARPIARYRPRCLVQVRSPDLLAVQHSEAVPACNVLKNSLNSLNSLKHTTKELEVRFIDVLPKVWGKQFFRPTLSKKMEWGLVLVSNSLLLFMSDCQQ